MSPVSRGRKGRRSGKGSAPLRVVGQPDVCNCPECLEAEKEREQAFDELTGAMSELMAADDPLDAEIAAAAMLAIDAAEGGSIAELISLFERQQTAESMAMLLAVGSVAPGETAMAARAAAERLALAGLGRPNWADELAAPLVVDECSRLFDLQGTASMLACSFRRAGREHALVVSVDHADCGAAAEVLLVNTVDLPEVLEMMRVSGRESGLVISTESLEPAELRWQIENALNARDVHEDEAASELFDEDGPGYPVLATLVRARMAALPRSDKPPAAHDDMAEESAALQLLQGFAARAATPALPAKQKSTAGRAPIYQIKVGLSGATPPIWRRLEVPSDISLARLHAVIQAAFGWEDSHMHVFETPYGDFGVADRELGYRSEKPVRLDQVAPTVKSKIRYVYDFGDNWQHDLVVEKVLDRDPTARYPKCTGGRRAAPPDDSGGIWGYLELVHILSDPDHPEHRDRMEWLGIDDVAGFAPDRFDREAVNQALLDRA